MKSRNLDWLDKVLVFGLAFCLVGGIAVSQANWSETYNRLRVLLYQRIGTGAEDDTLGQGDLYVGDGLEVDGAINADGNVDVAGAVTLNSTTTHAGFLSLTNTNQSFSATVSTGGTTWNVSGSSFPANYAVFLEPTTSVTDITVSGKTQADFDINFAAVPTSATIRGVVVGY